MNANESLKKYSFKYLPQLLIIGLIIFSYSHNLWFDFTYVDDNLIVFDEYDNINSLDKIPSTFVNGYLFDNYYRPMVMISFIIDTAIAGQSSLMYHLTNIILHIIVTLLLFKILLTIGIKKNISLLAACFYAVHPLNVSAVSWIVGRNDLLLAVFSVSSLFLYMRFRENNKKIYLVFSLITYLFAMLSKEAGVLIPALIIFYELLLRAKNKFKLNQFYSLFYFILPALIYFVLRKFVAHVIVREEIGITSFFQNIYILFEYIAKTVYFFYIDPLPVKNYLLIWVGIVTFALLILFLVVNWKSSLTKYFLFGFLIFLTIVLPTLFVRVNADDGIFNYIDCRMYLPLLGLTMSYAVIFEKLSGFLKKSAKLITTGSLFIYLIVFTFLTSSVYKNGIAFWGTALKKNPDRATYWMGLGYYYLDNKMYSDAVKCATNAINLKPDIGEYYLKAAFACEAAGDFKKAIEFLEKGLDAKTDSSINLSNLIKNYLRLGDKVKADELKNQLEQLDISDLNKKANLYSSVSYYYSYSNYLEDSIILMRKAIYFIPDNPVFLNDLGVFYYKVGEIDSAKNYISQAIQLDPNNLNYQRNLNAIKR
ncbi:MAG: tetratricopeptide repeat protein [Ignavibacteriaceae bacterium]|nr:tetratricopeptide repeat protein [Ignavibacteriaceae bacterium]